MTKTTVINIKTDTRDHKFYQYIGRGTVFGNPFYIGKNGTREEVIEKYKLWFQLQLQDAFFKAQVLKLKGKVLGCYCAPKACHGHIIADYLDNGII